MKLLCRLLEVQRHSQFPKTPDPPPSSDPTELDTPEESHHLLCKHPYPPPSCTHLTGVQLEPVTNTRLSSVESQLESCIAFELVNKGKVYFVLNELEISSKLILPPTSNMTSYSSTIAIKKILLLYPQIEFNHYLNLKLNWSSHDGRQAALT